MGAKGDNRAARRTINELFFAILHCASLILRQGNDGECGSHNR